MRQQRILIVEDERELAAGLQDNFEYEGYEVAIAQDGEEGLNRALTGSPDLILLDVMLPKLSGLDVCRELSKRAARTPIIMLTARGQEVDKVIGLEIGADDYVTKPFGLKELVARVRACLRRNTTAGRDIVICQFGNVELDFKAYRATKRGKAIDLSPREFEILRYFAQHKGETVTREQLLDEVWGYEHYPITRTVDNHIAKLRQKIEDAPNEPQHIITIHRFGYKFID